MVRCGTCWFVSGGAPIPPRFCSFLRVESADRFNLQGRLHVDEHPFHAAPREGDSHHAIHDREPPERYYPHNETRARDEDDDACRGREQDNQDVHGVGKDCFWWPAPIALKESVDGTAVQSVSVSKRCNLASLRKGSNEGEVGYSHDDFRCECSSPCVSRRILRAIPCVLAFKADASLLTSVIERWRRPKHAVWAASTKRVWPDESVVGAYLGAYGGGYFEGLGFCTNALYTFSPSWRRTEELDGNSRVYLSMQLAWIYSSAPSVYTTPPRAASVYYITLPPFEPPAAACTI